MTRQFQVYLDSDSSIITYSCVHCRAHLADHRDLVSKAFHGSQGRAYLFEKVINVKTYAVEDRLLLTGQHRVADLHCACCNELIGWKYEKAYEQCQRYKEGKCIIELVHLIKENKWDDCLDSEIKKIHSSVNDTSSEELKCSTSYSSANGGLQNDGFFDSSDDNLHNNFSNSLSINTDLLNSHNNVDSSDLGASLPADSKLLDHLSLHFDHPQVHEYKLPLNDDVFLTQPYPAFDCDVMDRQTVPSDINKRSFGKPTCTKLLHDQNKFSDTLKVPLLCDDAEVGVEVGSSTQSMSIVSPGLLNVVNNFIEPRPSFLERETENEPAVLSSPDDSILFNPFD